MITFASDLGFVLYSPKDCMEHVGTGYMDGMDGSVNGLQFLSVCIVFYCGSRQKLYIYKCSVIHAQHTM